MKNLQKNVRAIRMPEDVRMRIAENIQRNRKRRIFSPAAVAAALALCLVLPVGTYAAGRASFFKDVKRWDGAVVGTAYENATDEIAVTATKQNDQLIVTVTLLKPEEAPYPYIEELSIGTYQFLNEHGKTIAEGTAEAVPLTDGQAIFSLPIAETHTLRIMKFTANAKAEQPLPISGEWRVVLTKAPIS